MLNNFPILTILVFLPLAGAFCILAVRQREEWARRLAFMFGLGELALTVWLLMTASGLPQAPGA